MPSLPRSPLPGALAGGALALALVGGTPLSSRAAPGNEPAGTVHPSSPRELVGRVAPETTARTVVGGGPVDVLEQRGNVGVLAFVATWCGACRTLEPYLRRLHEEHEGDGLRVVAYSHEPRRLIARHFGARQLPYPVAQCTGRTALRYAATALPTVVAVDRGGVVQGAWQGVTPELIVELRRVVEGELGK